MENDCRGGMKLRTARNNPDPHRERRKQKNTHSPDWQTAGKFTLRFFPQGMNLYLLHRPRVLQFQLPLMNCNAIPSDF